MKILGTILTAILIAVLNTQVMAELKAFSSQARWFQVPFTYVTLQSPESPAGQKRTARLHRPPLHRRCNSPLVPTHYQQACVGCC